MATIAVDFDHVIHGYSKGWHDGSIYDPPVPGAIEGLRWLMSRYAVFILTARDPAQVIPWLNEYGFMTDTDNGAPTWQLRGQLLVTNRKLPASAYIDDRAIRFVSWQRAIDEVQFLSPTFTE